MNPHRTIECDGRDVVVGPMADLDVRRLVLQCMKLYWPMCMIVDRPDAAAKTHGSEEFFVIRDPVAMQSLIMDDATVLTGTDGVLQVIMQSSHDRLRHQVSLVYYCEPGTVPRFVEDLCDSLERT